jgi:two-component system sensor histidine kinase FlrB
MLVSLPKNNVINASNEHLRRQAKTLTPSLTKITQTSSNLTFLLGESESENENTEHAPDNYQRFSHLISIMPAGVVVVDKKGMVSLANQQAISLLGEPVVGESWREIIGRVFAPKDDDGHEVSMSNGKKVKIDISPLTEEKGQLIVITDLTQTRELQSRVGHMQRLSSLGKMVASLAHQVRTPLSSALLYAENLKAMPLENEMATRFSEKLTLRLKELESQVNDMLLFAKSSDKQIVSSLNTHTIVSQSVAQTEAQLKQANIRLVIQNQHKTSAQQEPSNADNTHFVLGNLTALTGAITNLIANAMQALEQQQDVGESAQNSAADEMQISISLGNECVDDQHYCVFTVSDNGTGLSQKEITRIFEPFYTTKSQGTGLGLAVVNTVAKSHKGFVKCGNGMHGGAFFALYIPKHIPAHSTMYTMQQETNSNADTTLHSSNSDKPLVNINSSIGSAQ